MSSFTTHWLITMEFAARLIQLRKQKGLTQQALADAIGLHSAQIKRYEAGTNQPSVEALKKMALALGVSADFLLFDDAERGPGDDLRLQFDVISHMDEEEQRVIRELIDGMILKYQTHRWAGPPPPSKRPGRTPAKRPAHRS